MTIRNLLMFVVAGALSPMVAHAADLPWQMADDYAAKVSAGTLASTGLTLDPAKLLPAAKSQQASSADAERPTLTLDAGGTASRIHGFFDARINSQYITPRGLIAVKRGPQFQVLGGIVFDLYHGDGFINGVSALGGIWADLNSHPNKTIVTGADIVSEVDIFTGFDVKFAKDFDFAYTIQAWTFPDLTNATNPDGTAFKEIDPTTEYNMDFKFSYDDSALLKDFALHPYVDVFWNFAGDSSPVVSQGTNPTGVNDHTFYVELGIAPSYTLKAIADVPITFTLPAYFTFGDSSFWGTSPGGARSNLGVASVGLKISAPLTFIPKDYGNWSTYVGVTYIHTCNPALTSINAGAGGGDGNLVLGYAGIGFGF